MESGLSDMSYTTINGVSLKYDEEIYNQGLDVYQEVEAKLNSIKDDFSSYIENAAQTENENAPIGYNGIYYGIISSVQNSLDILSSKIETIKASIEQAKNSIESYSKDEIDADTLKQQILASTEIYKNLYISGFDTGTTGLGIDYSNIYDDDFMPQGITIVGDKILVTAYDTDKKQNSRIYVYDKSNKDNDYTIILNNKTHVGGITYDKENHVLLVTGSHGSVKAYDYDKISVVAQKNQKGSYEKEDIVVDLADEENYSIALNSNINMNYEEKANGTYTTKYNSATTYYDNETNKIYIGKFGKGGKIVCGDVEYDKTTGTYNIKNEVSVAADSGIQGMSTYHKDGKTYLVETRSYGENKTEVTVRDITKGIENDILVGSTTLDQEYGEGIYIDNKGQATIVHESGYYGDYDHTTTVDVNKIIEENNKESNPITILDWDETYEKGADKDNPKGYDINDMYDI